jgi:uncharacterized membrane protein
MNAPSSQSTDPRIAAYLQTLSHALAGLPEPTRGEVFDEIRQHIDDELAQRPGDETAVPEVLDRLGDPADIAREAGAVPGHAATGATGGTSRKHEIWALALLEAGGFLGVLALLGHGHISGGGQLALGLFIGAAAWVVGVILLWSSRHFTFTDKLVGTLLVPGGFTGTLFVLAAGGLTSTGGQSCEGGSVTTGVGVNGTTHVIQQTPETCTGGGTNWVLLGIYLAIVLIAVVGPIYTTARLGRRISEIS